MKEFRFEYEETTSGVIVVYAETEEEARDLCFEGEGCMDVVDSDLYVGKLLEVI